MQPVCRALTFALAATMAVDAALVVQLANKDVLASTFLSPAAMTLNPTITTIGHPDAMGTFTGGQFGISDGVMLSTGKISWATIGKDATPEGTDHDPTGDSGDSTSLIVQIRLDDVVPLQFGYVFASRELPEFGGTEFNDKFTMLVNGENRALLSDGKIVTINNLTPSKADRSKDNKDYVGNPQFDHFSYTGYTKPLQLTATTTVGMNTINITIADYGDGQYDSAVFLLGGSLVINTYSWAIQSTGSTAACSVTCGTGTRSSAYQCVDGFGAVAASSKCKGPAPTSSSPCTLGACPAAAIQWTVQAWGSCSVTCGVGTRSRMVMCGSSGRRQSSTTTSSGQSATCVGVRPDAQEQCSLPACITVSYMFATGAWGMCSVTCGTGGSQFRTVSCQDSTGVTQSSDAPCGGTSRAPIAKPLGSQACSAQPCASWSWSVAQWGMCSVTCASGVRQRIVGCRSTDGAAGTDDQCAGGARSPTPKPADTEICTQAACPSYSWQAGVWGGCSATCDTCIQIRSVSCADGAVGGIPGADAQCSNLPKPDVQRSVAQPSCRPTCSCTEYCTLMTQHCQAVFPSKDACMTVCNTYPPGVADVAQARRDRAVKDTCIRGQNDACCRLNNARLAASNPERYCPFASHHGGGMCGTYCQGYCNLALQQTPDGAKNGICYGGNTSSSRGGGFSYEVLDKEIVNLQTCERVCDLYPTTGQPYDATGNTVHCRTQQLLKAAAAPALEKEGLCLGGSYHGGGRCGKPCEGCAPPQPRPWAAWPVHRCGKALSERARSGRVRSGVGWVQVL